MVLDSPRFQKEETIAGSSMEVSMGWERAVRQAYMPVNGPNGSVSDPNRPIAISWPGYLANGCNIDGRGRGNDRDISLQYQIFPDEVRGSGQFLVSSHVHGKMTNDHHHHHGHKAQNLSHDDGRGGLDPSNLYGNPQRSMNGGVNNNPLSQSMSIVMPQAMKSSSNGTGRKYQCKMCPQVFGSKADMQLHTQVHMREAKPYKCSQCSKAFANSSYLSQHTRIHLGIKPYRCEICARKFTQLSHLQQHIRTHTGDKPYKCRHMGCTKAFSQLSNLQSHSRCHQTDKPFKCNSCYKCFTDENALLDHIPKHKESKHLKTHICEYCGKSYTQETYLAKHMAKHADRMDKRSRASNSGGGGGPLGPLDPYSWKHAPEADGLQSSDPNCAIALTSESSRYSRADVHMGHLGLNGRSATTAEEMIYNDQKQVSSASAFTPIQQVAGSPSHRAYFPYDSFNFSAKTSSSAPGQAMDMKLPMDGSPGGKSMVNSSGGGSSGVVGTTAFPNQLIALHQIRNYASMPSSGGGTGNGSSLSSDGSGSSNNNNMKEKTSQ